VLREDVDKMVSMLTAKRLRQVLKYNPETGIFRWKTVIPGPVLPGDVAGALHGSMHRQIRVDGQIYQSGRLAWLYMKGRWPKHEINCINGNRSDIRWANLREITRAQGRSLCSPRSKLGVKGVWGKQGSYVAQIRVSGQKKYLGTFDTLKEASAAYAKAAKAVGLFMSER
jgi:hypothetical protein